MILFITILILLSIPLFRGYSIVSNLVEHLGQHFTPEELQRVFGKQESKLVFVKECYFIGLLTKKFVADSLREQIRWEANCNGEEKTKLLLCIDGWENGKS